MKKLICFLCALLLGAAFFYSLFLAYKSNDVWISGDHPSGYKVYEGIPETDSIDVTVYADSVLNDWYEYISYENYVELEQVLDKDQWQKIDDIFYDEHDVSVTIRIEYPPKDTQSEVRNPQDENLFIYDDDIVVWEKASEEVGFFQIYCYQMPAGTCEKVNGYLQQYYQKQHDIVTDFDTFFPELFAGEYGVRWTMKYLIPTYKDINGYWVNHEEMYCPGSSEMSEELLVIFGNANQWTECYYDSNLFQGWNENNVHAIYLYGDDFCIRMQPHGDGRTYIAVDTYAAFLAPKRVYKKVEKVLNHYEDQWEVIPLVE